MRIRQTLASLTTVCLLASLAIGQTPESLENQPTPVPTKILTLENLKETGRLQSRLRDFTPSPLGKEPPQPKLAEFNASIKPVLLQACVDCHGPDTEEGNIRIDTLDPNLLHGKDVAWWLEVLAALSKGEMPPPDEGDLSDQDRAAIVEWLTSEIQVASAVRRAEEGHSSFRRMTRYEYNYALQDLLGLPYNFARDLPPDASSEDGFQNSSETLTMSAIQFSAYRQLSHDALQHAIVRGEMPHPIYWDISMKDAAAIDFQKKDAQIANIKKELKDDPETLKKRLKNAQATPRDTYYLDLANGHTASEEWAYYNARYARKPIAQPVDAPTGQPEVVAVIPPQKRLILELGDTIPEEGMLRVRVRAARASLDNPRLPSLSLEFGWQASNDSYAAVRVGGPDKVIDAVPDSPQFYEWRVPLSEIQPRNSVRHINKLGDLPSPSEFIKLVNSSVSPADVQIDHVTVAAGIYEQWPPASHTRIFIESVNQTDETNYAREILSSFMSRAWRRPVTEAEVAQKIKLFTTIRPQCTDFEEAMTEVLAAVLSSPQFLYLSHSNTDATVPENVIANERLATRLSIFLWCSIPDQELLTLAAQGKLSDPTILNAQVDRMLADPRSRRFSEHFVRQWLGLQLLDYLNVDRKTYPQFDPALKEAMLEEPVAFFDEVLRNNESVLDFIHADYTVANERLAMHYGIKDVHGNTFRRVNLQPQHQRGGLLTQAGLLAMNSDGKDSHPLKRGIWVLKSLLNDPPPPPPAAVPIIDLADPEIAKMTLKQRIENHRNQAACKSCHAKIDPWGIAFENFDAIGRWRTEVGGQPVDASSMLSNNQELDGVEGLKRYLLEERQDQFTQAVVHKLTSYALGRHLNFGDRASVDDITAKLRQQGDGLATAIKLIVASDLFQSE
ncbi:DUF1592 domain-containing protein [Bremerella cremea]|uniref:DUF1592 domain-containing protein n=1 Tax=Bremerella cremea TaxID=1031537 RepID=A0A368KXW3_9BACT|nr:DUF1592 domain-containing protein [Bremerella cremea]RCS54487.1 DUF1592 domain-containing protein [Bremerella cremea]